MPTSGPKAAARALPEKRARNDKRRARNRDLLLRAAVDLAAEHGEGALTPVAIARGAGLHKQAFYVHFKDLEECALAVGQRIALEGANAHEQRHAELVRRAPRDRDAERREVIAQLAFAREHANVYRVLAGARFSDGPVTAAVRGVIRQSRTLWTSVFLEIAMRVGIRPSALVQIEDLAAAICEMGMASSMRVIEDPSLSLEAEAARHIRYTEHLVRRELRHLYRMQNPRE